MKLQLKCLSVDLKDVSDSTNVSVSDAVFKYPFKPSLIHQVVSIYLMNSRQGSRAQKGRSKVSGSNKKPWRQKGTGRARSGSVKSPIWRSGGVTFAAQPKKYDYKINKKMYRGAIKSILSKLVYDNRLFVIDDLFLDQPKTKLLSKKLQCITLKSSILIFTDILDNKNLFLASRNLYKVEIRDFSKLDPVSLISFDMTLITSKIIKKIENQLI